MIYLKIPMDFVMMQEQKYLLRKKSGKASGTEEKAEIGNWLFN